MGGSFSTNIIDETMKAVTKVSTKVINNNKNKIIQIQSLDIKGKDIVVIDGLKMNNTGTINMSAFLEAFTGTEARQELAQELEQVAKASTSGINLLNFSDANNSSKQYIEAVMDVMTNIKNTCRGDAIQNQKISIETDKAFIKNVDMKNAVNITNKCILDAITQNKVIQDLQQKAKQTADATTKGFSIWAIVIGLIVVLLGPIIVPIVGAGTILLKILFPLLFIIGLILLWMYFYYKKKSTNMYGYSRLLKNLDSCIKTQLGPESTEYQSVNEAADKCEGDDKCVAFDWQAMTINPLGEAKMLDKPITTFYSSVKNVPCPSIEGDKNKDGYQFYKNPRVLIVEPDEKIENLQDGDVFVFCKKEIKDNDIYYNTYYKQFDGEQQKFTDDLPVAKGQKNKSVMIVVSNDRKKFGDGDNTVTITYMDEPRSPKFEVQTTNKSGSTDTINIPIKPVISAPVRNKENVSNSTGYKQIEKYYGPSMLIAGGALLLCGLMGTVLAFLKSRKNGKEKK